MQASYAPPILDAGELETQQQPTADAEDLQRCWLQREPARQLPHLDGIPTVIVTTEASYHAAFDHCTLRWLRQAGVSVDAKRLADLGIHGNGHMVMLEKNNLVVALVIDEWIRATVR